ncbi:MAG: nuclease [Paracoccus sp. (in: a-proteobacteria)]|nr:nuclease [Paracoccus sp. (in: a-proteobacteria)]
MGRSEAQGCPSLGLIWQCKGQKINAEISDIDDRGPGIARCTLADGRDLSGEIVEQGLALDWAKFSGGCYRHLETPDARKRLWLADARQKGRMPVWEKFAARSQEGR